MQNPCQDSYYTLFSSYPMLLDYHEEQAKNSRWIRCKVADLQVEPLGKSSPLIGNLSAFAAGTSQEAVKDTAENLGLAMRVNGELYPVRMTAYHRQTYLLLRWDKSKKNSEYHTYGACMQFMRSSLSPRCPLKYA